MKYRPEIDGLRSIAVLPVILFHGGVAAFSGGFVGVDVFFVISGYLITTIIVSRIDAGRFSLLDFYNRRARRILPALVLVVACSIPFAWIWMLPTEFKDFAQSISAVSLFSSNFLFWIESDYFAAAAEEKPLLHTWSLAVEEQYYIVFPLLLMLFWRRWSRGTVMLLCGIFLISLIASQILSSRAPETNFYLLPSRAWELMAGSLCAIWLLRAPPQIGQGAREGLAALGLGLILLSIFVYDKTTPFPSVYALAPVLGTALIILFAVRGTGVARLLSLKIPVGIGLISYSAYLWHQPLFAFARLRSPVEPEIGLMMGLAALSLGLAYLSWRFVEQPFRHMPWAAGKVVASTAVGSLAVFALGVGLGYSGLHQKAFIAGISPQNRPLLTEINRMKTMDHYASEDAGDCRFYVKDFSAETDARFAACAAQYGKGLVVFGDSHSIDVYKGLIANWDLPFLVGVPQETCRPHVTGSDCETTNLPRFLDTHADRIALALYSQAGFWLLTDEAGNERARRLFTDGSDLHPQINEPAVARAMAFLQKLDATLPVAWLGPRLEPHVSADKMLMTDCDQAPHALHLRPAHEDIFRRLDDRLKAQTQAAGLQYISDLDAVRFDIATELYTCEALYWSDGDHWSPAGEDLFGGRIVPPVQTVFHMHEAAAHD